MGSLYWIFWLMGSWSLLKFNSMEDIERRICISGCGICAGSALSVGLCMFCIVSANCICTSMVHHPVDSLGLCFRYFLTSRAFLEASFLARAMSMIVYSVNTSLK
jgi:hypothetical protein